VIRLAVRKSWKCGSTPDRVRRVFVLQSNQFGSGVPTTAYWMDTGCSSFGVTRLKGKANHLPPCSVSLRKVCSATTGPHMPLCLTQRQMYVSISIWNLHLIMQYLDTLLLVNVHHSSECCPSVLKTDTIPVLVQRMWNFFYGHNFLQIFSLYNCVRLAMQCVIKYILILIILCDFSCFVFRCFTQIISVIDF
jgi:hypothetical protein